MEEITRQCIATSKGTGQRCRRAALPGGRVCQMHGGASPQTLAAARRCLDRLREPAIAALNDFLESQPTCLVCGRSDDPAVRLAAIKIVLDRTGLGPTAKIEIAPPDDERNFSEATNDELIERLERMLEFAREQRDHALPAVTDGALADDGLAPDDGLEERADGAGDRAASDRPPAHGSVPTGIDTLDKEDDPK